MRYSRISWYLFGRKVCATQKLLFCNPTGFKPGNAKRNSPPQVGPQMRRSTEKSGAFTFESLLYFLLVFHDFPSKEGDFFFQGMRDFVHLSTPAGSQLLFENVVESPRLRFVFCTGRWGQCRWRLSKGGLGPESSDAQSASDFKSSLRSQQLESHRFLRVSPRGPCETS